MAKTQCCVKLLTLLCVCSSIAVAQNQSDGDLQNLSLEQLMKVQFYTASKHAQDASETPASVTIITREDIRSQGARTLADVLQNVRGFWINSDRNYSYLGVRGFARPGDYNTRVLFLLNGHRLNDNIGNRALIGTEFPIDMDLVERIEIVRGPGSSLYGTNALFGVINVITQQPPITPLGEVSVSAATLVTGKARVTVGVPKLMDGALFSASTYHSNGNNRLFFPEFDSPGMNNGVAKGLDGDQDSSGFALLRWKHLQFQGLLNTRRKEIPTASFGTIFNDSGNHTTDASSIAELSYQRDFDSGLQVNSRAFYDGSIYSGSYAFPYGPFRALGYDKARGDSVGTETNISRPLGHRNVVTAGMEFRYSIRQEQKDGFNLSPVPIFDGHRQSNVFAFYGQDELRITSRLMVNAGVRVDHYSTFGSAASPRVAAIFHADHKTTIKYSYGQAFRAPNAYELFYSNGVTQEPNPGLRPERIASQDVGVERVLSPTFHVVVEGFYNALSHMLEKQPVNGVSGIAHFVNVDSSSGKGLEFELDAQHKGTKGELSYTVQRSIAGAAKAPLADSPQHIAKLNMSVPLPQAFLVGAQVQYLSAQHTPPGIRIPESLVTNLTVSTRKPILGFDMSASCYNLLNRRNYDPPQPFMGELRLQQDGRGFRVQISRSLIRR